jgi:hypothetical protein
MDNSLPAELVKLQQQFERWRSTRATRSPIPDHLLQAARALLDRYPPSLICRACRLHSSSLRQPSTGKSRKARTDKAASPSAAIASPVFFSLPPAAALPEPLPLATDSACRLVVERTDGARLTFTLPQLDAASLSTLCVNFLRS